MSLASAISSLISSTADNAPAWYRVTASFQPLRECAALDDVGLHPADDLTGQQFLHGLQREALLLHPLDLEEELLAKDRDVWGVDPSYLQDIDDFGRGDGAVDRLLHGQRLVGLAEFAGDCAFGNRGTDRLEEADLVANLAGRVAGHRQRIGAGVEFAATPTFGARELGDGVLIGPAQPVACLAVITAHVDI